MKRFKGKVTLITGGGKGIGFGLATAFAREGSNLVITGRNMERLNSAKERLEKEWNVEVLPIVADGADEAAVKMVVGKAYEKFGRIDTLINNAQASKSGLPLIEHSREDFDLAILSGIYGAFF
ncbi:MAG: SDR family NAD(P)-dependent oxidoreductase, partial [Bacteroidales bacterium]|nr:SDR family NAD(P)-dependent oxidoreductase [Bacteroidales bacterium]